MVKYELGKIYKITGNGCTYYGSTAEKYLSTRLANHMYLYKLYLQGKSNFVSSYKCFENDNDDYQIVLVETFPCKSKDELHARELFYIENNECVNMNKPTRFKRMDPKEYRAMIGVEYYAKHKDEILNKVKKYNEDNREKVLEWKLQKHSCECGGKYCNSTKARHLKSARHLRALNL